MAIPGEKGRRAAWWAALVSLAFLLPLSSWGEGKPPRFEVGNFDGLRSDGKPPPGWEVRVWKGKAALALVPEGSQGALHLKSERSSFAVYRDLEVDLREYPILTWRWKVSRLPAGGDVRVRQKDDQAAGLYVVFPRFPALVNSRLIGYIWETTAPEGLHVASTKTWTTKFIVLKSGEGQLGRWVEERRNVREDYRKLFGEEPPTVERVSVMIDSDDTESAAESFFSSIAFEREGAPAASPGDRVGGSR